MIDCTSCAQALPIIACNTGIVVGEVADDVTAVVVRFIDLATGRPTIAEIDPAELPRIVVPVPPAFAPGHSVLVGVISMQDDSPGAEVEVFPYINSTDVSPYPVTCIVFVPTKAFEVSGTVYPSGLQFLIV